MPGEDALGEGIGISKQIDVDGGCGCVQRDASLFEFVGEVRCGETIFGVSSGNKNTYTGGKGEVRLGLEFPRLGNKRRTRRGVGSASWQRGDDGKREGQ
jgi:hypothetical protein